MQSSGAGGAPTQHAKLVKQLRILHTRLVTGSGGLACHRVTDPAAAAGSAHQAAMP
jgi:hypothetical protein